MLVCADVNKGRDVLRICYDKAERHMLIQLKSTYYQYSQIDPATVNALHAERSKRQFFAARIGGNGTDGPFDCRTHPIPKKSRR